MEAAIGRKSAFALLMTIFVIASSTQNVHAQNARSRNFLVHAKTQALADAVAKEAERFRNELAEYWLGRRLPDWPDPCPIEVISGPNLAAQGATTYTRQPTGNYQMRVIGTPERILDSVLPHEVTHTVMATHFGRPLPRWADEGICTTVEHDAEKNKHEIKLREYLSNRRGIPMNDLFLLKEYPSDLLPMYAQGYSVCRFLIAQSGPREFISFLEDYMAHESWTHNVRKHYGYDSLKQLQDRWLAWVAQGSGPVETFVSTSTGSASAIAAQPASRVALASATSAPGLNAPANRSASPHQSSRGGNLGSSAAQSWYQRSGGQNAVSQVAKTTGRQTAPSGPQISSGHYSVAQPQSEQGYGSPSHSSSARSVRMYR